MAKLPSGVVTFLFTDIEASTETARALGDHRWSEVLAEHQRRLRGAFEAYGGCEVHSDGDAFLVAFERAADAIAAAIAGQVSLESTPWPAAKVRVRMGIHTGEALLRGGDYIGHQVHLAKRICDAGHGGQVIVSAATSDLVRHHLPNGVSLAALGAHCLKDFLEPRQLFQLCAPQLPAHFPPLRSLAPFRDNLPAPRSPFVGRERELGIIRALLREHRLVTLTGMGGCGKTRLALEVGGAVIGDFRDGAVFVDLAPISDPHLVVRTFAVATSIVIDESVAVPPRTVIDLLLDCLAPRRCLVVIDNCEHLLDATAQLADGILARCPGVVICATSRAALEVDGERTYHVPSLTVPTGDTTIEASESVRLFCVRARASKPDFQITPENRDHLAEICRRVDGIPLAIEFAAARVSHLSPQQIAERLDDAFRLLTGSRRSVRRQQTLEATLDWSHDLLREDERTLFRRLAVFAGSFDLASAESTCSDATLSRASVLDLLRSLVVKSLVTTEDDDTAVRYRLLETVRAYAAQRLRAAGESAALRTRHRDWYVTWLESLPFERTVFDHVIIARMRKELDNIRAAADWSVAEGRTDLLGRLACRPLGLWWFAYRSGEGHQWLLKAVESADRLSAEERVMCHSGLSLTSMLRTEGTTIEHATRAIELACGRLSGHLVIALEQRALARATLSARTRDAEIATDARRDAAEGIAVAQSGLNALWLTYAHHTRGQAELLLGNVPGAAESFQSAVAACEKLDAYPLVAAWALSSLSVCQHLTDEFQPAVRAAQRALQAWDQIGHAFLRVSLLELVPSLASGGEREVARALLRDALRDTTRIEPLFPNTVLILTATFAHLVGMPERAARLLGAGRHMGRAAELPVPFRSPSVAALYRHYVRRVRAALGRDVAHHVQMEGRAMMERDALAYGLATIDLNL